MNTLVAKRLLVVISGGIAAYKSPDVVRRLRDAGADVRVIMTRGATAFITPLSLQAASGHEVHTDLIDERAEAGMGHIELARWADAIVVAPATADFLARLRHGRADDLACAVCLASTARVLIAPAMNQQMWQHPATQDNLAGLTARGVAVCGPDHGSQACGEVGPGRMVEAEHIVAATSALFRPGTLGGRQVLVTAGPTREAIDPVRYISNHSSGKMGYAVAQAAFEAGAAVTLVSGPTALPAPEGIRFVAVESAADMLAAVLAHLAAVDIFIATAAVADYHVARPASSKIKRDSNALTLELAPNPDILATVAAREDAPFTVGFAAETDDLLDHARAKLEKKGIDLIAANAVGGSDSAFNRDDNELTLLWSGGSQVLARQSKQRLARQLIAIVAERSSTGAGVP